ncbi:MAG: helix-turn-helix domain-containing protein [Pseudomonadota bacterium]
MKKGPTTAERILEASRLLFNEKGYAATRLTEIAEAVGISQGNLTYHFPTKRELANRLQEQARSHMRARRTQPNEATPVD